MESGLMMGIFIQVTAGRAGTVTVLQGYDSCSGDFVGKCLNQVHSGLLVGQNAQITLLLCI